jgi:hypothetical protein
MEKSRPGTRSQRSSRFILPGKQFARQDKPAADRTAPAAPKRLQTNSTITGHLS